MSKVKIFVKWFSTIILVLIVFLILIYLSSKLVFKDKVPNAFGYSILRVVTGSMDPTISVGDFVVIKKCDKYKVNDIITFIDSNDNIITHRIKKIDNDIIVTKGDANNTLDDAIKLSDVQGKVIYHFKDIFKYKDKIVIFLLGLFILGGLVTICIPNRKK